MRSPSDRNPSSRSELARHLLEPFTHLIKHVFQRAYFQITESIGQHKRDILVHRVAYARDGLEEAKDQFQTALEKFSALTHFDDGELGGIYRQLQSELDYSRARADAVKDRIGAVRDVADALFNEWETELEEYDNRALRNSSRQKLKTTRRYYEQLMNAMARAENKIEPVLRIFNDQVLYLKHNLNAQAIAALEGELAGMSVNVAGLINAMERSIQRANTFMDQLNGQKALPAE